MKIGFFRGLDCASIEVLAITSAMLGAINLAVSAYAIGLSHVLLAILLRTWLNITKSPS